jgi:arsenate reductase
MKKPKILAICIHNSARSQMVEEYLRLYGGDLFEVESAGLEPGNLNPTVVALLHEEGIDISSKSTRSVFDLHAARNSYDYVIAVCDPEAKERCPIFPAERARLHWPFPDPSSVNGTPEERLAAIRPIAKAIKEKVLSFVDSYRTTGEVENSK